MVLSRKKRTLVAATVLVGGFCRCATSRAAPSFDHETRHDESASDSSEIPRRTLVGPVTSCWWSGINPAPRYLTIGLGLSALVAGTASAYYASKSYDASASRADAQRIDRERTSDREMADILLGSTLILAGGGIGTYLYGSVSCQQKDAQTEQRVGLFFFERGLGVSGRF